MTASRSPRATARPSVRAARQLLQSLERAGVTHLGTAQTQHQDEPIESGKLMELDEGRSEELHELETLDGLEKAVSACRLCQELAETRTSTVFGVGDPEAKILFIGEAPGADEDRQGEPFVGRAGKLLDQIIEACGIRREEIYICNILKCRPPENRNPTPDEAGNCRKFLDGQIAAVRPEYIVCWGSVAAKSLLDSTETIGRMRRKFFEYAGAKVLCTYHPSYLLRNPSAKKDVWEDMQLLFADMGINLTPVGGGGKGP